MKTSFLNRLIPTPPLGVAVFMPLVLLLFSNFILAIDPATTAAGLAASPATPALNASQRRGEEVFKTICVACHTINQGRLVGPDLANIDERLSKEWLLEFIKSSQAMIQSGDPEAVRIFNEFNRIPMPDPPGLTEADIQSVIDYIVVSSPKKATVPVSAAIEVPAAGTTAVEGDGSKGKRLFAGPLRLKEKGPACNSCHNVRNDTVMAGGSMAKDLTRAYTRLTEAGIKAVLKGTPFPAMKEAYGKNPLTEEEIANLTAFLKEVDQERAEEQWNDYGKTLLYSGFAGAVFLMGIFPALWRKRKKECVNRGIFERQMRSSN